MEKLKCIHCGKRFVSERKRLICSQPCREARAEAQRKAWFKEHADYMARYYAKYYAEHRDQRSVAARARYQRKKSK